MASIYDYSGNVLYTDAHSLSVPWVSDMHRGYTSDTVAQNTLAGFYRAFLNGADWIEVDVRLSSDSVYVCAHNPTVTDINGVTYTIASETAETLTALVLSRDDTYGDCCVPTLESVLKLCAYTGLYCNLDCKTVNASTLSALVVDCGMSGRTMYANSTTSNASTILNVDPNAGFLFAYSSNNLESWATVLTDYHTRQRSYAWATTVSYEAMEETRAYGFKYLLSNVSTTSLMSYCPDCIEFIDTADCKALNEEYLASLSLT